MAKLNITEAAQAGGVIPDTIHKYIRMGKIRSENAEDGTEQVDTSELLRIFGLLKPPFHIHNP